MRIEDIDIDVLEKTISIQFQVARQMIMQINDGDYGDNKEELVESLKDHFATAVSDQVRLVFDCRDFGNEAIYDTAIKAVSAEIDVNTLYKIIETIYIDRLHLEEEKMKIRGTIISKRIAAMVGKHAVDN